MCEQLLLKGYLTMEQKNHEQKTAQILYITIIMVLLIMAITVGLVSAANKASAPAITTAEITSTFQDTTTRITTSETTSTSETTTAKTEKVIVTTNVTTAKVTDKPTAAEVSPAPLPEFILPAFGNVSEEFSIDTLVYSNTMEDYRTHNGIDICAPVGDAVCAAADGIVTKVYEHPMMGYTVVISHDSDFETVYQNMDDDIPVMVGDVVKRGDVIGAIGESALIEIADEAHLHFEMCIAGERVNPLDYISDISAAMSYDE